MRLGIGVRILCSKIRELCYALMLTIYANYAPQISHYAPEICHYASKQNNFSRLVNCYTSLTDTDRNDGPPLAETICPPAQHWSWSTSRRHLPPNLQRLLRPRDCGKSCARKAIGLQSGSLCSAYRVTWKLRMRNMHGLQK